jgi:dethiobiotin synthetase
MSYIIAGIHTGIGKTLCSTILCEMWGYDYWKPVQAGDLHSTDSHFIEKYVSNPLCIIHPEAYRLKMAASPHFAADTEGVLIQKEKFVLPKTNNKLIVETAGGLMSPLAKGFLNIDLIKHLALPVILVSENYLGSINHTLLSVEVLKNAQIPIHSLVFNGEKNAASEEFILTNTGLKKLFSIPRFDALHRESIKGFCYLTQVTNYI